MTDEQLMLQFKEGDKDALAEIFSRYKTPVFNYAARILNNRAEAEDVTGEIFMILCSDKYHFQETAKFKTWLYRITHNACIDRVRRSNRLTSMWFKSKDSEELEELPIADRSDSVRETMNKEQIALHVKHAINQLPLEQREALILREYHNCSYDEIAEVLQCSLAKVKVLIFRAREALKNTLPSFIKEGR